MIELFWIDDMKKIWDGVIGTSATDYSSISFSILPCINVMLVQNNTILKEM
jgi:hypothetical protein